MYTQHIVCSSILDEILATVGAIDLFMVWLRGEWIWYILIIGFIDEAIELIAYIVSLHMLYIYILRNACIYIYILHQYMRYACCIVLL